MRVALVTPTYWPEVRRGAERFVHELAGGLGGLGHEPVIVTTHPGRPARTVEEGIDVVRAWRAPDGQLRRRMYEDYLTAVPGLALALRRVRPDAVVATHATSAVASEHFPTVFAYMGIPLRAALVNRRARLALVGRAVGCAREVTALSEYAGEAFARDLGVRAHVVPPPVDTRRFSPGGPRDPVPTVVCAADATEPRKRVDLLIEACARLDGVRLLLDRATAAPAPGVELVDMSDLTAVYRRAWVSVLPSWGEAFGLVLAEALACGTPVVGTDLHGIPEVLGDAPVGALFENGDVESLASALRDAVELARDPATVAACRARAETFSTEACAAAYDELLGGIAGVDAAPG